MAIDKVGPTHAVRSLSHFLFQEADLDTLAKLYSLYITQRIAEIGIIGRYRVRCSTVHVDA